MRLPGGMKDIEAAIEKLSRRHEKHIKAYDPKEGRVSGRVTGWLLNLNRFTELNIYI